MNFASETFTTDFESLPVSLKWRVKNYCLSAEFFGENDRILWSPVYNNQHCIWKLGLVLSCKEGYSTPTYACVRLILEDSESDVKSIIVNGELRVSGDNEHEDKSHEVIKTSATVEELLQKLKFFQQFSRGSFCESLKFSIVTVNGNYIRNIFVNATFLVSFGKPLVKSKLHYQPSFPDDKSKQTPDLNRSLDDSVGSQNVGDLVVHVAGKRFRDHKAVFAARSPVFKTMIQEAGKTSCITIKVECASEEAWSVFQHFLHTGQSTIEDAKVRELSDDLFRLAKEYQVSSLTSHLVRRLRAMLGRENVLEVLEIAYRNDVASLREASMVVLRKHLHCFKRIAEKSEPNNVVERNAKLASTSRSGDSEDEAPRKVMRTDTNYRS